MKNVKRRVTNAELREALREIAEEHEYLLYGECAIFAIAMHKLTGLPLYGITGYDWEVELETLVHAYVRLDAKTIVDIRGPRSYDVMLDDFADEISDATEARFTVSELARLGLGRSRCPSLRAVTPIAERVWAITQELHARRLA